MAKIKDENIFIQPFNVEVKVVFADTMEKAKKYWNEKYTPKLDFEVEESWNGVSFEVYDENNSSCFGIIYKYGIEIDTIAHECFHMLMRVADYKGAEWNTGSDEWYAHALGKMVKDVLKISITVDTTT